jgi:S1-C subfamily serine protease
MLIRRIRKSELGILAELLNTPEVWPDYSKHYLNHRFWVQRALEEVKGENRIVFGAFLPSPTRGGTRFENSLAGCIFVKSTPLQDSAELKGLAITSRFFPADDPLEGQRARVAERLIGKAVRFCQVREVPKLEIEIPQDDHAVLSLFLRLGFRVAAIREKYRHGKFFCVLERTVGDTYAADPFDYTKVGRWLLRAVLPCQIDDTAELIANFPVLRFHVHAPHVALQSSRFQCKQLSGLLAILEEDECTDSDIQRLTTEVLNSEQAFVRYAFVAGQLSDAAQEAFSSANVVSFDLSEIRIMAGGDSSSLAIPFSRDNIGGIITVLEQDSIHQYKRLGTFAYYLLSGIGGKLEVAEDAPLLLVIYCPDWRANANAEAEAGIVGFAEVTATARRPYDEATDAFEGIPSALAKEDLDFYRTFGDSHVVALRCEQIRLLSSPIPIPIDEAAETVSGELDGLTEWTYLHRELVENLASAVYLSETAAAFIRLLPEQSDESIPALGPDFEWKDDRDAEELQRLLRRNPMTFDMVFLQKAVENARSVCFVDVPGAGGSGVLVAPDLVLTCRHVLYSGNSPQSIALGEVKVRFRPNFTAHFTEIMADVAKVHPECDAVLLRLRDSLIDASVRPVVLSKVLPPADDDLSVLHYPLGGDLKLTWSAGGVVKTLAAQRALQYVTDTAGGSSGGPCFNSDWELVGIHRAEKSRSFGRCGEGVLVPTVLDSWIYLK